MSLTLNLKPILSNNRNFRSDGRIYISHIYIYTGENVVLKSQVWGSLMLTQLCTSLVMAHDPLQAFFIHHAILASSPGSLLPPEVNWAQVGGSLGSEIT